MWVMIGLTVLLVACVHWLLTNSFGYWKKRGVPYPPPRPLVGNVGESVILRKPLWSIYQDIYNNFKDCLYVGLYKIRSPALLIRDPELIKNLVVKDFSSFHDNDINIDEKVDPIMAKNPFCLKGQRWKVVRSQVTANITTGKIKNMSELMTKVGENLVTYLNSEPDATGKDGLETKELAAKFTTDVVAACAFGLEGNSFTDPNSEFRKMGRQFLSPSFWTGIKHMMIILMPALANLLHVRLVPENVANWFSGMLMETIKYRKENKVVRNDYLDMMIALKSKPGEYEFTDLDVIAQAMTFYADGFETSSIVLSFTLYEIAANPLIQDKLRQDINAVLKKHNGKLSYDAIQDMTYLDNVLSEGLRKYPPGTALAKICTKPYTLPPVRGEGTGPSLDVKEGMVIILPVYALHHDPNYYPEPEKFDPDRFTEEQKSTRPKCTYLPFGEGPRQCLGYRFALAQTKIALASIVTNFDVTVNPKTITPLQMDPTYFLLAAKGGLWMNFKKIRV